jgi:PGF-CTERM protein
VSSNAFSEAFAAFWQRGMYTLIVITPGSDGFETDPALGRESLPSGLTQQQAVAVVRRAYSGDEVVELSISAHTPSLGIDTVADDGMTTYGTAVTVSGRSNRANGTDVTLELLDGSGRVITTALTDVNGVTGEWSADLNTSDVEPGSYTVVASTDVSDASAGLVVVADETETPAEPLAETSAADESTGESDALASERETLDNVTDAALANGTEEVEAAGGSQAAAPNSRNATDGGANATTNRTANGTADGSDGSTSSSLPGFGVGAVVAAVVVVVLAARRHGGR